ncbi:MAG: zinc metallopeptidase [Ardenticatenales bacterium]|nr:zinc metallopeptidase [Ardenticatenales bacterium]
MKWRELRRSENVEDRRRISGPAVAGSVGGIGLLIVLAFSLLTGADPQDLIEVIEQTGGAQVPVSEANLSAEDQERGDFIAAVLGSTEDVWSAEFSESGADYPPPDLVLFTEAVASACGNASAAMGPFYCPADQKVYIDLSFYQMLQERFGAPGDFAQAYVIAHEVGHHIQNVLGTSGQVEAARRQSSSAEGNELSVRLELQADCFAGMWARNGQEMMGMLEEGDIEEALNAAEAIGDDRLQKQAQGYVVPDAFTHGTSEQRASWFARGLNEGSMERCDTFSGSIDIDR